jgi:signal transduction histidine kinase
VKFKGALVKLTLGYLCLIMLACGILSIILYKGGARPLERRLELRQRIVVEEPFPPMMAHRLDPNAVSEVKHRFALFLVYFNVGVFCIAGLLSYGLARREIKPMEEALELQGRFTSDAAHEIRTPLTAMKAEIEVALRGGGLRDEEARELLESNLEEIGKLEALSTGLLKLAQYEEGSGDKAVGTIELGSVIEESLERVRYSAAARGIDLELELEDATVPGDRGSLIELLVILLDNSIKYSDDGTTVKIATHRGKRDALIVVRDEGYGIDKQDLAHVFDRFYRGKVPVSKKQVEGYGLGLSIAKRIADLHHGSIEMQSETGIGTTATVRLPLVRTAHGRRGVNAAE